MRKRETLGAAIARAGSAAGLGRLLGVRPETVRRWRRQGITAGGKKLLAGLEARRAEAAKEEANKRQTFALLFKLAGERGDLRKTRSREGTRAGPRTSGYQWVWAVGQMLTHELIAELDAWMAGKRKRFPMWQAVALATEYTKQKFKGYKVVMKQVPDQEASGDFAVEENIATRRDTSLTVVRGEMVGKLEEAIEEGALVYIHEIALFNYRLRTEEERLAWEAGKRSARRKAAKKTKTKKEKKAWTKKKQPSKKPLNKSKAKTSKQKVAAAKKSLRKSTASRSKSASTRLQPSRSSSARASGKASVRKTSSSRSARTTSTSFSKKPKSTLKRQTLTRKTSATTAKKTTAKKTTAKKTTAKKTNKTSKR
jgi:hypothetical protein